MAKIFSFFWFWGSAISLFHVLCPLRRILDTNVFVNFDDGLFFVMLLFWKWVYPKTGQLLAQDMDGWSYEVPKPNKYMHFGKCC